MSLVFELADGNDRGFQLSSLKGSPDTSEKQQWRRWLPAFRRGSKLGKLQPLYRKFEFRSDHLKPLGHLFYPQGPGSCDHNSVDRAINLITTLPFFGVAWHTFRERKTAEGKLFGASIAGVGLGSMAFHSTSGDWRPFSRKLDYWAIALSSIALSRSIFPEMSPNTTRLAMAATAVNPLAVSSVNAVAFEGHYFKRAQASPELRKHHRLHAAACGLGAVCFVAEDVYPHWCIIHSVWHCLSAFTVASSNYLLANIEAERRCPPPPSDSAVIPVP